MLFTSLDLLQFTSEDKRITPLTIKLDQLAVVLELILIKNDLKQNWFQYHKSRYGQCLLFAQDQLYVKI